MKGNMQGKIITSFIAVSCLGTTDLVLAQEQQTNTLDTLVVTANRAAESRREVAANVTVLDAEKINNSNANNMAELMSQQGFVVINQGTQKILQIRGMGQRSMQTEMTSEILVLLNGRRIGANNVSLMGLDNVERVEIIRGPSAVQFGPSAMGGVVNIITKRGSEQPEVGLEFGLGSNELYKKSLSFSGAYDQFDIAAAITHLDQDDYKVSHGGKWRHTDNGSMINSNVDLGYTFLDSHRLGVNFNYADQHNAQSPGTGWMGTGAINKNSDYNQMDLRNYNMAVNYEGATADNQFNWLTRYSFGQDKSDANYYNSSYGNSWANRVLHNDEVTAQTSYNGELVSLTLGFDHIKYKYDQQGTYSTTLSTYKDSAGYLAAKLRLLEERLIFSAGGRYDHYAIESDNMTEKRTDNNFTPSVGIAFLPVDWFKLRTNYSEGFKMPGPDQLAGDGWRTFANYDLKPEKSKTYEVGFDSAWRFIDTSFTYFHTNWDDKIIGVNIAPNRYQNQNLEGATISGLELGFKADLGAAFEQSFELSPYVNLTYLTDRKNKDKDMVAQVGKDTLLSTPKTTISYGLTFAEPSIDFKANLNAAYFSSVISRDWRVGSSSYGKYVKNGGGTVVDMNLEQKLVEFNDRSKLSVRVELNNLFNNSNERHLDYPGPGRNYYLGFRYKY